MVLPRGLFTGLLKLSRSENPNCSVFGLNPRLLRLRSILVPYSPRYTRETRPHVGDEAAHIPSVTRYTEVTCVYSLTVTGLRVWYPA